MLFNSKNKKKKKRQKNIGWLEKSVTVGASFRSGQTHTRPKEGGGESVVKSTRLDRKQNFWPLKKRRKKKSL